MKKRKKDKTPSVCIEIINHVQYDEIINDKLVHKDDMFLNTVLLKDNHAVFIPTIDIRHNPHVTTLTGPAYRIVKIARSKIFISIVKEIQSGDKIYKMMMPEYTIEINGVNSKIANLYTMQVPSCMIFRAKIGDKFIYQTLNLYKIYR